MLRQHQPPPPEDITFATLVAFFDKLAARKPRKSHRFSSSRRTAPANHPSDQPAAHFQHWLDSLKWPLPKKTGKILFRLIFPDLDVRRRYNLQEARLAKYLVRIFDVNTGPGQRGEPLLRWNTTTEDQHGVEVGKVGCLGSEVEKIRENMDTERPPSLNLARLDQLLDELAAPSSWSNLGEVNYQKPHRPQTDVLQNIYQLLSPRESAYITQIILKDLRPLLYPLPSRSTYIALTDYNSAAFQEINQYSLIKVWHWAMPRIYRAQADLDKAADACEQIPRDSQQFPSSGNIEELLKSLTKPQLGTPVHIPKAFKASGPCLAAPLSKLKGPVWAETKMDGERMQIHIDTSKPEGKQIQIFSKSHRDSTKERATTHIPIRATLGLHSSAPSAFLTSHPRPNTLKKIESGIFEAEMVAWNMSEGKVDEFWRIVELKLKPWQVVEREDMNMSTREPALEGLTDSQLDTMDTQQLIDLQSRHLALCFFDVLYLNGESLLESSYEKRREILEECIHVIPNYSMLVERKLFDLSCESARDALRRYYATVIAERHEGLVLKPAGSIYNDYRSEHKWLKAKKDYIDGFGDTADYAIIGASWDQNRGRELRVPTSTYTIWYVGLCDNTAAIRRDPSTRPNFQVVFTSASYGLSRPELEKANRMARENDGQPPHLLVHRDWPFKYQLAQGLKDPAIIFKKPFVFELMGSGFTKRSRFHDYELRWPRITKLHEPEERDWSSAVDRSTHNEIAKKATFSRHLKVADEILGGSEGRATNGFQAEISYWHDQFKSSDIRWLAGTPKSTSRTSNISRPFVAPNPMPVPSKLLSPVPSEMKDVQSSVANEGQNPSAHKRGGSFVGSTDITESLDLRNQAGIAISSSIFPLEIDRSTDQVPEEMQESSPQSKSPAAFSLQKGKLPAHKAASVSSPTKQANPKFSNFSRTHATKDLRRPRLVTFVEPGKMDQAIAQQTLQLEQQKKQGTKRRNTGDPGTMSEEQDGPISKRQKSSKKPRESDGAPPNESLIITTDKRSGTLSHKITTPDGALPSASTPQKGPSPPVQCTYPGGISTEADFLKSLRRPTSASGVLNSTFGQPAGSKNADGKRSSPDKAVSFSFPASEVKEPSVTSAMDPHTVSSAIPADSGVAPKVEVPGEPLAGQSTPVAYSTPPWRDGTNVRWCLVLDEDSYGIAGTRYNSVSQLLESIKITHQEFYLNPQSAGVSYIFIQNPKQSNLRRIQKQIVLRALSNPNVAIVGYDSQVLELKEGNQDTWKKFELFRFNSYYHDDMVLSQATLPRSRTIE